MRSMSAFAPLKTRKAGWKARRFIGRAERRLTKPECISPEIERQWARSATLPGRKPASGKVSREVLGDGERVPDDHVAVAQARHQEGRRQVQQLRPAAGIRAGQDLGLEVEPAIRQISQPRRDHEE